MNQNFTIVISATDRATATVRKVNDSISRFVRPITEVKKATTALGKELGVEKVAKSMAKVSTAAKDVSESIGHIIAPLAAVFGIGSIAAIGEFAKKWGEVGAEIGRTATTLGVSTRDLQLWRGAAKLAGVSAEAMTGGMKSLGDTMWEAKMGGNNLALGVMSQLHLNLSRTKNGAVDTTKALMDMAGILSNPAFNPETKSRIAKIFGIEALLPLLRQGPEAIKRYLDMVEKSGAVMSGPALAAANAFYLSLANLDLAFTGLKNAIASKLGPALDPLIDKLKDWIIVHRELIATKVEKFVQAIGKAIEEINWTGVIERIEGFCSGISHAVEAVGGFKTIMKGFLLLIGISAVSKIITIIAAIKNFALAFGLLNAELMLTPIGWVIASVALLAGGAYLLYKKWDRIALWWKHLWGGMSDDAYENAKKILDANGSFDPSNHPKGDSGTPAPSKRPSFFATMSRLSPVMQVIRLIRKLEGSGDTAVSKKGAIGRYQITPDTARTYGFDPNKLKDPAYSETAVTGIVERLLAKYNGDIYPLLAEYHSGPGGAKKFLKQGMSGLGPEGQKYLNHAQNILGQSGPAVDTPYKSAETAQAAAAIPNGAGAGAVTVLISFENAPRGMKTKTETNGPIIANTKISYAMPEFGVT